MRISKWGNSLAIRLPAAVVEALGLKEGDEIEVHVVGEERKGKSLAALVPVERLEQMRRFARRHALQFLDQQTGGPLSDEEAMELALAAQRAARERPR